MKSVSHHWAAAVAIGGLALTIPLIAADKPAERQVGILPDGMDYAVKPKPLSPAIEKGLKFLAERQNKDGGWSQGGGWRTNNVQAGGRVEGNEVADPSDVGNTSLALLALYRAGNTPVAGPYKENVKKGLNFLLERVEKSDDKDLYVTDVRNTQLQSKIGPYVDTFLTTLILSELKGTAGQDEKRLVAGLDKAVGKITKNQKEDGTFANNAGWAPVLSQGIANKALSRARQNGVEVKDEVLARVLKQSEMSLAGKGGTEAIGIDAPGFATKGTEDFARGGLARPAAGDAGVALYGRSAAATNFQDYENAAKIDVEKARELLKKPDAKPEDRKQAEAKIEQFDKVVKQNAENRVEIANQARDARFVAGFGSNGGEEFLSFLNISEMLLVKADKDWLDWDGKMQEMLPKVQDEDGGWSGHHCITGRTFCTSAALLVLMADRTPFPKKLLKATQESLTPEKPESKEQPVPVPSEPK